jgi:predicted N-acetyltransferase YhbS
MRRNMPKFMPAVTLGRLAIDRAWQGRGVGRALLADVVRRSLRASSEVSARLVIVHAISPAAEAFYLHHGFTPLRLFRISPLRALSRDRNDDAETEIGAVDGADVPSRLSRYSASGSGHR